MQLKLLYPTDTMETVDVGIPTIRLVKILSNLNYFHDGTMGQRTVACLCGRHDEHEKFVNVSSLDGLRIARASKRLEFSQDKYIPKGLRDSKGNIVLVQHNLSKDVKASNVFAKDLVFEGKKIKLKPQTVTDQTRILSEVTLNKKVLDDLIDLVLFGYIESIDGEPPSDELPLKYIRFVAEKIGEEQKKYETLSTAKDKDSDFTNEIGIFDQNFLLGENGKFGS